MLWRKGLLISAAAVISLGAVACTPRTEIPADNNPSVTPTEKYSRPCGYGNSDFCGNHHNNNRKSNEGSKNGTTRGSHGSHGGGNSSSGGGTSRGGGGSGGGGGNSGGGGGGGGRG